MTNEFSNETGGRYDDQDQHHNHDDAAIGFSIFSAAPRVLHVDADADAALVLAALLVPETRVTHVASLAAAQALLRSEQFALVVIDPDLPDGDGGALLHHLHQHQSDARVLLYSARHPERHMAGSSFLPKPWTSPRQLWRTVSDLLATAPATPAEPR
jgi:two-component system phosphate regulon response regulator OmpR